MNNIQPLEYNSFFHIYNRGINGESLFREASNYQHFMRLYDKYISPVANTYAWVLLGNHFHLLVRIKSEDEVDFIESSSNKPSQYSEKKKYLPTKQFSHLFNAYSKAVNKKYDRTGGLFETPFRRIKIENEVYFKRLVFYIHNNPVHHGFVSNIIDYPWSSYLTIVSDKKTNLNRQSTLEWFNSKSEFEDFHKRQHNYNSEDFVIE